MRKNETGQTLFELTIAVAMLTFMAMVSSSVLDRVSRGVSLAAATSELRSIFHHVRTIAVAHDRNVAVKFQQEAKDWTWAVYEDGDGDGVRNDDIQRGRDRQIQRPRRFQHRPAIIGLPRSPVPDPFAAGKQLQDRLPVRFGTSTLCSFSRDGQATNGSIVLTDGTKAVIVQVSGAAGRIGVLRWNGKEWKSGE